jgi:hypothetical protein
MLSKVRGTAGLKHLSHDCTPFPWPRFQLPPTSWSARREPCLRFGVLQIGDGVGTPTVATSAYMKKRLALVVTLVALTAAGVGGGWHWGHAPSHATAQAGWASGN